MRDKKQKYIASARAALGNYFENIVKLCNLSPNYSWKDWFDDQGNSLYIKRDNVVIHQTKNKSFTTSDIFARADFDTIAKHSRWTMFYLSGGNAFFWFIGNDERLRLIEKKDDVWINHDPILSGFKLLKIIALFSVNSDTHIIENFEQIQVAPNFTPDVGYMASWPLKDKTLMENLRSRKIG